MSLDAAARARVAETLTDLCPRCGHGFALGGIPCPCVFLLELAEDGTVLKRSYRMELLDDLATLSPGQVVVCPDCAAILFLVPPVQLIEVRPAHWFGLVLSCEDLGEVVHAAREAYRTMRLNRARARFARRCEGACEGRGEC